MAFLSAALLCFDYKKRKSISTLVYAHIRNGPYHTYLSVFQPPHRVSWTLLSQSE